MQKRIITISREFGSGGRYIGRQLAEKLGYAFYDGEIIAKVASETGFSKEFIEQKGEYSPRKSFFSYAFVGRDSQGLSVEDRLYEAQVQIILDLAKKGNCVIVGRCADYILREKENCCHVFIQGTEAEKTKRIASLYDLTEAEATKKMKEMDKKRSIHYNYYTDRKWGDLKNYDITLNSGIIGIEECIEILAFACK